jgi:rubrerythrin
MRRNVAEQCFMIGARSTGMSGRGETPDDESYGELDVQLTFGQTLYDEDGAAVGTIRGLEAGGVFLTTRDGVEALSVEHARSGHSFGAAELVWRCTECGEMGEIDEDVPDRCPNCDAPREQLMYWTED